MNNFQRSLDNWIMGINDPNAPFNQKDDEELEKFECAECGCFYWVEDRDDFICPNCEDKEE